MQQAYHRIRDPADEDLYSSRESAFPGIGYPSCSRALSRVSRFYVDANFYYADLGLPPWASDDEIKSALRRAFKKYHPDGTDPDEAKFLRYKEISEVLLNPELKRRYDETKEGEVFIDSEIRRFLSDEGIVVPPESLTLFDADDTPSGETLYDYFSFGMDPFDCLKAQEWYEHLVAVAPIFFYTSAIKVLLYDGSAPNWLPRARMLMIPRWWNPGVANAFALFSVVVNAGVSANSVVR